jgi:glycosyltransferase involved in cell wall biosynthesis
MIRRRMLVRPRISIVMCTYNGASFVGQQLASLAAQTLPPNELVVCDDRSTDDTVRIVRDFASRGPFPVRVEVNDQNLGVWGNFARATSLAGGEWVMLCDQDDIWRPHKLERFAAEMTDPKVGLVFCDARVVDSDLRPVGHTQWQSVDFGARQQAAFRRDAGAFAALLKHSFVAGATMAFRADLRQTILPLPSHWAFDAWAAVVAAALTEARIIAEPLNDYRQHAKQALGGARKGPWRRYVEARRAADETYYRAIAEMAESLRDRLAGNLSEARIALLDGKVRFARARAAMRRSVFHRYPLLAVQLISGRYWRYGQGLRSLVVDALV